MVKGGKKIFVDRAKLSQLLNLRQNGLSLTSLATLYSVDTMSISHQLKKYQVEKPAEVYDIHRLLKNIIPQPLTMRHPQW
jgi:hypothetical protein